MTLALVTLENDIYTTFRNHLITGTYKMTAVTATTVTPVYSDTTSTRYGFPVIEVGKPIISNIMIEKFGNVKKCDCTVPILIVEDNAEDSKTTTDECRYKLLTGEGTLKEAGVYKMRLTEGSNTIIGKNNKHYHYTRININFEYRERL